MRRSAGWMGLLLVLVGVWVASAAEVRIPADGEVKGSVLIAERFEEWDGEAWIPLEFPAWPGDNGVRPATWFTNRIEAHPGDTLILAPGGYTAQIWVFAPGVTVMTDPDSEELAVILGTVEVDADGVVLERIAVTDSGNTRDSGHGIELNREFLETVTVRECRSFENRWTGIHIVGATGRMHEIRVENCELIDNGMDGMDALSVDRLVVTGCTITGNGWGMSTGVGIRIGSVVGEVEIESNVIEGNRFAGVYRRE